MLADLCVRASLQQAQAQLTVTCTQQIQVPRATDSGGGESNGARLAKIIVPSVVSGLIVIAALLACLLVCVVNMFSCVLM